jgi:hypothetical protein
MPDVPETPAKTTRHDRFDKLGLIAECCTLFGTEYYHSFLPGVESIVKLARDRQHYKHPEKHIGVQLGILEAIEGVEEAASKGKKIARDEGDEEFRLQSRRNKFIGKAYRQIADGVAWRTLDFSRFTVRVLSQARSPGAAWGKDVGRNKEKQRALNVVRNGGFVLIHDATNYLRVGDLSSMPELPSNKPYLAEVKNKELITASSVNKKLKRKMKTDKQEFRLYQAQIMITDRMFYIENDVPVVDISPKLIDYMSSASAVMKKAAKEGIAANLVTPYMFVDAVDIPVLMKDEGFQAKLEAMARPKQPTFMQQSNYDYLQLLGAEEVARNVAPYTIFPLPANIVAKLITGEMILTTTLYADPLREEFAKYGWRLDIDENVLEAYEANTDAEGVAFFSDELLFPGDEDVKEWIFLRHPNGFVFPCAQLLLQMAHEFTSVQYVVSVAEEVMKHCTPGGTNLLYPDVKDSRRWL